MLHGNFFRNHIKIAENIASMPKRSYYYGTLKPNTSFQLSTNDNRVKKTHNKFMQNLTSASV